MNEVANRITLNTFDDKKVLSFTQTYEVNGYFTFNVSMESENFKGKSNLCAYLE